MGEALASNKRIAKIAFTGETTTGRLIMQYASQPIIPQTLELGGKSPNIFFADVMDADDDFLDKALEGFALFAFNKGEVCTCPSRALIQESIYDKFMERAIARVKKIKQGHPLDMTTMIGAQASNDQMEKILSYFDIGKQEGAEVLVGGEGHPKGLEAGYFVKPTVFVNVKNDMTIAQEEIFGPVLCVITYDAEEEAIRIANDSKYGLHSAVLGSDILRARRVASQLRAGRVVINNMTDDPQAPWGGFKYSGVGREYGKYGIEAFLEPKAILE